MPCCVDAKLLLSTEGLHAEAFGPPDIYAGSLKAPTMLLNLLSRIGAGRALISDASCTEWPAPMGQNGRQRWQRMLSKGEEALV